MKLIKDSVKEFKTRRDWKSPKDVEVYFEKTLKEVRKEIIKEVINFIAEEWGWEESKDYYLKKFK